MAKIKITPEDIERAREKNIRRIPTLTIDRDLIEAKRPLALPVNFVYPGEDVPPNPTPDDIDDDKTLPYVGSTDAMSGKIITAEDKVVRCKTEGRYHLKASWEEFGKCPTCQGIEYYESTDEGFL